MRGAAAVLAVFVALAAPRAGASDAVASGFAGRVGYDQHLDRRVPAYLPFRDESGRAVRIDEYLGAAPVGLVFSYYGCSSLCPTVLRNLAERLGHASGAAAKNFQIVVVSIDPHDSPALAGRTKLKVLEHVQPPLGAGRWHFLTGAQADVAELAAAVGFRYAYDDASHQYAHPAGFALLTPEGRIARYFFGFDFTADELSRAIDQASARRIASPIERLLLLCFHDDTIVGRYSATIIAALRGISVALLAAALAVAAVMGRRSQRLRNHPG
jgi:protein SCO1/2